MKTSVIVGLAALLASVGFVLAEPPRPPARPDGDGIRRHGTVVFDVNVGVVSKIYRSMSCSAFIQFQDRYKRVVAEARRVDSKTYVCRVRVKYDFPDILPWYSSMRSEISIVSYQGATPLDPVNVTTGHEIYFDAPKNGSTLTITDALTL